MKSHYSIRNFLARNSSRWLPRHIRPLREMKFLAIAFASLSFLSASAAEVAYTAPLGGMTYVVPAGQTRTLSFPLSHFSAGSGALIGQLTGVGSNFLDVADANWTAGSFSTAANPYYVRILSGAAAGRVMMVTTTANTATRVFVNNDGVDLTVAGGPAAGDRYELVLADTLGTLFGANTLQGGADAASADNVQVWGGAAWLVFYYNNVRNRWERNSDTAASPSRDTFVLRPDRGMIINRKAGQDLTLRVTGRVPVVAPTHFHTRPGITFISAGLPVDRTLGTLALQSRAQGWTGGTSASSIDYVQVWGGASWFTFYYNTTNNRWQREGDATDRTNFVVPAGRPMMVRRVASGSSTLISQPLPYTVN